MTHQMLALILGMLPIFGFGAVFAIHVLRESRRIDRCEAPLGLGRKSCDCARYIDAGPRHIESIDL